MNIEKLVVPTNEYEIKKYWKYKDRIYISCVCITFNQKDYIRDTIDSFLAQKTEYCFEIIIHDDVSTDGTRDILLEYKNKYPSIIKLVLQDVNQYSQGKRILPLAVRYATGEYIAFCEGDDFWIDKYKLQKQIKIFLNDEKTSLVHSGSYDLLCDSNHVMISRIPRSLNTTESLFNVNGVRTLTAMFKMCDFLSFYDENNLEANKWPLGDWPLWIYFSTKGCIVFLPDVTSVYRVMINSASHSQSLLRRQSFRDGSFEMLNYMMIKYVNNIRIKKIIANSYIKNNIINRSFYCDKNISKDAYFRYKVIYNLVRFNITYNIFLKMVKLIKKVKNK